jgi:hypothetical protein
MDLAIVLSELEKLKDLLSQVPAAVYEAEDAVDSLLERIDDHFTDEFNKIKEED